MELEIYGEKYCNAVINNANILGNILTTYDFKVIKVLHQYTYTHQIFLSMPQNSAEKFYNRCLDYGVSINYRTKYIYKTCGLRIGTQEISRYGWDNAEMLIIAEILRDIRDNNSFSQDISDRINILSTKKQLCYTIEKEYFDIIYNALHYS